MFRMWRVLGILLAVLPACGGPPGQRDIHWREADRLYLAGARNGVVRVFDTRNGPVPYGQLTAKERRSVRDMQLDERAARLWVLGDDALYVYDARLLMLVERRPLPDGATDWQRLELADAAVTLVSASRRLTLAIGRT